MIISSEIRKKVLLSFFGVYLVLTYSQLLYANDVYNWSFIPKISFFILLFGFIFSLITRKKNSNDFIYLSLLILGFLIKIFSGEMLIFSLFLVLFMLKGIDFNSIVKIFISIVGTLTTLVIILSLFKIIPTYSTIRTINFDGSTTVRNSLGFMWVTFPAQLWFYICLTYIFLKKGKISIIGSISLIIISFFIYFETNTKNPFILEILLILIVNIFKYDSFKIIYFLKNKVTGLISIFIFPLLSFLSLLLAIIGSNYPLLSKLNELLSNRIFLSHVGLMKYPVSLFGRKIHYNVSFNKPIKGFYFYLDNSFINYLLTYGFLLLAIILVLISITMYYKYLNMEWYVCLIFIFIAFHSFGDPQLIFIQYSPFILIVNETLEKATLKKFNLKRFKGSNNG